MTDEQIIKAYERCFTLGFDESTCYECPFYTATAKCTEDLRDSALDLINRQKAEIERLKKNIDGLNIFTTNHMKVIRLQAIKEFAERLKDDMRLDEECKYNCISCCYECKEFVPQIDNLVKEMTEEK